VQVNVQIEDPSYKLHACKKEVVNGETRYTIRETDYQFGGMNSVSKAFRIILARACTKMPKEIVDWTAENLCFLSSLEDSWAHSLMRKDWEDKLGFVFLCEVLKNVSEESQVKAIAHEIAPIS